MSSVAVTPATGSERPDRPRVVKQANRCGYYHNVMLACCGCKKTRRGVESGISGEKRYGFLMDAAAWGEIYVPQDVPSTIKNIETAGGINAFATSLKTDPVRGIEGSANDLQQRTEQFGINAFPEPLLRSWFSLAWESMKDLILIILLISAAISITIGTIEHPDHGWADGLAILAAVIIVAGVTATNDFNKQLEFLRLAQESAKAVEVRLVRGGREITVHPTEVVVGDVVLLDTGCKLPADGLLIRGTDIKCNESALTGESDEIKKDPIKAPVLLSGTFVTSGTGVLLVTAVGTRSLQGQIMKETAAEDEDTPLQRKLDRLATKIGYVGLSVALFTFIALMVIKATGAAADKSWGSWTIKAVIYGITIAVVSIPEGLPLAVTVSLAYSTGKMLQDKNLVRKLDACETMGNATDICTDKTGTLTENRMTIVAAHLAGKDYLFDSSNPADKLTKAADLPATLKDILRDHLSLNATAAIVITEESGGRKVDVKGSKTEGAGILLINAMAEQDKGADYETIRNKTAAEGRLLKQNPFSSEKKMMSTVVLLPDGRVRVYVTGGSDFVLARCTSVASGEGEMRISPLTPTDRHFVNEAVITPMANQSLRTLALAYREFPSRALTPAYILAAASDDGAGTESTGAAKGPDVESDMTLYGVLGIKDPLRKGVTEAVDIASRAGVRVRMVTGDNKITATAIARECHILRDENDIVMEGPVFRTLTPKQLDLILPRLAVLARSSPKDKMILVRRLNGNLPSNEKEWKEDHPDGNWETQRDILLPGYYDEWKQERIHANGALWKAVVGVTGDGTNDAPALKASDVGLAMGIAGTEVAKEACDIIITDDNFASIVNSILWGRSVYDNVRAFLQFQITVNCCALLLTFVTAVMQEEPPLNPVMLLFINLIMDTLGALALATQTPSRDLLLRAPYSASTPLINRKMWRHILVQGIFQFILLLVLFRYAYDWFDITVDGLIANGRYLSAGGVTQEDCAQYRSTFLFNTFTFMTVFNEFNSRSLDDRWNIWRGITKDRAFIGVVVASAIIQALLVEFGGTFVKTTGLIPRDWGITIAIALVTFPLGVAQRFIPVNNLDSDLSSYYERAFGARMAAIAQQQQQQKTGEAALPPGLLTAGAADVLKGVPKPTLVEMTGVVGGGGTGFTPPSTAVSVSNVQASLSSNGGFDQTVVEVVSNPNAAVRA